MFKVSDVVSRVRYVVNDTRPAYRNADEEIFGWISDCLNIILTAVPQLFSKSAPMILQAGCDQTVANISRAAAFLGIDGYPRADLKLLDSFSPGWRNAASVGAIQNWAPSDHDRKAFVVYPPSSGMQTIPVNYVEEPLPVSLLADDIDLPDSLVAPIVQYCVGMVESKDDEHVNSNRAAQAKAEFVAYLRGA